MSAPILHHYPISAFSERVRLTMGLKRLRYRSVTLPAALPKPDQIALTGGYRRAPMLQVGADIYCDTAIILPFLERLHPQPSLYPGGSEGIAAALSAWADRSLFPPALSVIGNVKAGQIPADFIAERKAFGFNLDPADIGPRFQRDCAQADAELAILAAMLADGRPFLLGDQPGAADFAAFCSYWLLDIHGGAGAAALLDLSPLTEWAGRVSAIGHGEPDEFPSEEALKIAAAAEPAPVEGSVAEGFTSGQSVTVTPNDTGRDPVLGTLVAADTRRIVLRRQTADLGALHVHFPRSGFDLLPA